MIDQEKHKESIRDTTYSSLEKIADKGPKPRLAVFGQNMGVESVPPRSIHITRIDSSLAQYLYGRPDGDQDDIRPTVNLTQGTINTFAYQATRVPCSITLKSASVSGEGKWVLVKPLHIPPKPGATDPAGNPHQPIPVPLFKEIPQELLEATNPDGSPLIPSTRRICIDNPTVLGYYQTIFDYHRRVSRMDQIIRDMMLQKQIVGWPMGLFQWDPYKKEPIYHLFPPQHWFPDPTEPDVKDMVYVRLDWVIDALKAQRLYPKMAEKINQYASRSLYQSNGADGYSSIYLQTFQRPVVTLTLCYLRNQEAPMTLMEALQTGLVRVEELQEEANAASPAEAKTTPKASDGDAGEETAEGDQGAEQEDTKADGGDAGEDAGEEPGIAATPTHRIIHVESGDDLTASFDGDGNPQEVAGEDGGEKKLHDNHPHKLVTRQWVQLYEEVVQDDECPFWDIPVWLDKNVPIPGRPFSQPETERLRTLQRDVNEMHVTRVNHVQTYKGSAGFVDEEGLTAIPKEMLQNGFTPSKFYVLKGNGQQDFDIRKHLMFFEPPALPDAIPKVMQAVQDDWEKVAGRSSVAQGIPPSPDSSGRQVMALQAESASNSGFKSQYSEEAIYRMSMLTFHAEIRYMNAQDLYRINQSIPLEVLEEFVVPFARNMIPDAEVELNTGSAQVRNEEDAKTERYYAAKILDPETTRDKLKLDADEIAAREKEQREELLAEQAEAAAKAAPQGQPQQQGPSISISMAYKDMQPNVQTEVLQLIGLQGPQQPTTVDHQLAAAKIQNEANRTAVDAASKHHQMAMNEQNAQNAQNQQQPEPAGA